MSEFSPEVLVFSSCSCAVIAVLGTAGNLLAVMSLLSSPKLRRSSTYFLVNLSVSNIPVCLLAMPTMALALLQQRIYGKVYVSERFIYMVAVIGFTCNQAELNTICVLSANRVIAMFRPRLYQWLVRAQAWRVTLLLLWLFSIATWLPLATGWIGELHVSRRDLFVVIVSDKKITRLAYLSIAFTFPLVFSLVCNVLLLLKGMCLGGDAASQRAWRNHVTRTVLLVSLILLVLSVPHVVVHAVHERNHTMPTAWLLLHVLFFARYILDPMMYVLCSTEYRAAFLHTLSRLFRLNNASSSGSWLLGHVAPPCTPNTSIVRHKIVQLSTRDIEKLASIARSQQAKTSSVVPAAKTHDKKHAADREWKEDDEENEGNFVRNNANKSTFITDNAPINAGNQIAYENNNCGKQYELEENTNEHNAQKILENDNAINPDIGEEIIMSCKV